MIDRWRLYWTCSTFRQSDPYFSDYSSLVGDFLHGSCSWHHLDSSVSLVVVIPNPLQQSPKKNLRLKMVLFVPFIYSMGKKFISKSRYRTLFICHVRANKLLQMSNNESISWLYNIILSFLSLISVKHLENISWKKSRHI